VVVEMYDIALGGLLFWETDGAGSLVGVIRVFAWLRGDLHRWKAGHEVMTA